MIATDKIDAHLGARLRAARRHQRLSKDELAERLGVSRTDIDGYEAGEQLTAARLFQLARALETNVADLYSGLNHVSAHAPSPSDEHFQFLKHVIKRIAANHDVTSGGHRRRLARHEAVTLAREVCEKMGWRYGSPRKAAAE